MTVYCVMYNTDDGGWTLSSLDAVFSEKEKAEKYIRDEMAKDDYNDPFYTIEERIVDFCVLKD